MGYIPAQTGKMYADGMEILVKGDPIMRRPFIVMETNPKKFPQANYAGARALSDFLLSAKLQNFLLGFGRPAQRARPAVLSGSTSIRMNHQNPKLDTMKHTSLIAAPAA